MPVRSIYIKGYSFIIDCWDTQYHTAVLARTDLAGRYHLARDVGARGLPQTNTRLAIRRRPLSRRLAPSGPLRVAPSCSDRLEDEVSLSSRQLEAQPLPPVFSPHHRAPVIQVRGRLRARDSSHLVQESQRCRPKSATSLEAEGHKAVRRAD